MERAPKRTTASRDGNESGLDMSVSWLLRCGAHQVGWLPLINDRAGILLFSRRTGARSLGLPAAAWTGDRNRLTVVPDEDCVRRVSRAAATGRLLVRQP